MEPTSFFRNPVKKRFFAEGEQRIGGADEGNYYYSRDHLRSVREVTDASGVLKAQYDYDAWGNQVVVTGNMSFDFGYTGHYRHAASNLYLAPFRAYDSTLARWISRDPIGEGGGINLFEYADNDPTNWIDPLGHNPVAVGAAIGTFFGPEGTIIGAGIGAIAAVIGGAAVYDYVHNKADTCSPTKACPPCTPPAGTIGYRLDSVPPSKPHFPFPGDHVHLYQMNQNPNTCRCYWNKIGVVATPPPGAIPL